MGLASVGKMQNLGNGEGRDKHYGSDVESNRQRRGATTLDGLKSTKLESSSPIPAIQSKGGAEAGRKEESTADDERDSPFFFLSGVRCESKSG